MLRANVQGNLLIMQFERSVIIVVTAYPRIIPPSDVALLVPVIDPELMHNKTLLLSGEQ